MSRSRERISYQRRCRYRLEKRSAGQTSTGSVPTVSGAPLQRSIQGAPVRDPLSRSPTPRQGPSVTSAPCIPRCKAPWWSEVRQNLPKGPPSRSGLSRVPAWAGSWSRGSRPWTTEVPPSSTIRSVVREASVRRRQERPSTTRVPRYSRRVATRSLPGTRSVPDPPLGRSVRNRSRGTVSSAADPLTYDGHRRVTRAR